jgi:hypothetical protein
MTLSATILWLKPHRYEIVEDYFLITSRLEDKTFIFIWDDVKDMFTDLLNIRSPVYEEKRVFKNYTGPHYYCEMGTGNMKWFETIEELCDVKGLSTVEKTIVLEQWRIWKKDSE